MWFSNDYANLLPEGITLGACVNSKVNIYAVNADGNAEYGCFGLERMLRICSVCGELP
jgi:hypothetical protein